MGKFIDLTGERFGFWIVLKYDSKNKCGQSQWNCRCECGVEKVITSNSLRTGNSTSCGCNRKNNLINNKFGNLTVVKSDYSKGRKYWLCNCDCGNSIITSAYKLQNNIIISCGCKKIKCTSKSEEKFNLLLKHSVLFQQTLEDFSKYARQVHENLIKLQEDTRLLK